MAKGFMTPENHRADRNGQCIDLESTMAWAVSNRPGAPRSTAAGVSATRSTSATCTAASPPRAAAPTAGSSSAATPHRSLLRSPRSRRPRADGHVRADDPINHPQHHNANPSGVEAIDVAEHTTFNVGNAVK
jgi:hypothetical protein